MRETERREKQGRWETEKDRDKDWNRGCLEEEVGGIMTNSFPRIYMAKRGVKRQILNSRLNQEN